jgi:hypothetical protein
MFWIGGFSLVGRLESSKVKMLNPLFQKQLHFDGEKDRVLVSGETLKCQVIWIQIRTSA